MEEAAFELRTMVEGVVRALVDNPDETLVIVRVLNDTLDVSISVAPEDRGQVIGKGGRIIRCIRTLTLASSHKWKMVPSVNLLDYAVAEEAA